MESKFYTPSDDEFRIGFEFYSVEEIDGSINGPYTIKDCYDLEVQARNCWKNYSDILIKYLSKEDIESFGFKFDATRSKVDGNFVGSYENENYYLDYSPYSYGGEFNSSVHLRVMKIKDIPITSYQSNYQFIYDGIIKNKSELKKLLIQLNIINE